MFGLFSSPSVSDPELGELKRSRGLWRGRISGLGPAVVPLIVSGPKSAPDPAAMALAKSIAANYSEWRGAIELALFDHLEPYAEAMAAKDAAGAGGLSPAIEKPSDVWPHTTMEFVSVEPLGDKLTIEFGYCVAWDEGHTLGARFQDGRMVELCGSVLCP